MTVGSEVTSSNISQMTNSRHYLRIGVQGSAGRYVAIFNDTGIHLYDSEKGKFLGKCSWDA